MNPTIEELTAAVEREARKRLEVLRLMTHPGVGPLTALAYVLIIGTPTRFARGKQIGSLVVAEVMEDVKAHARYRLNEIFGDDAFYDRLDDVVKQYRQQFNVAAPSKQSDPTPGGVDRSA